MLLMLLGKDVFVDNFPIAFEAFPTTLDGSTP